MMKTAVIGGGAAGFFLAINLKEQMPTADVVIFERSQRLLAKVEVSGGGRCNCTNTFQHVCDLSSVYPRGHRLMKRLFNVFGPHDAYEWFERHGVSLVVQDDQCVFPAAQDSHVVMDCFMREAHRLGIEIQRGVKVQSLADVGGFDTVAVTTGGSPTIQGLQWLADMGHEIVAPVPSLFTLSINDQRLRQLMGTVAPDVVVRLTGTKVRAEGPLLVTHWGVSGPAVLRLSSYGARLLAECGYRHPLSISWVMQTEAQVLSALTEAQSQYAQKQIVSVNPFGLSQRLWAFLAEKSMEGRQQARWAEVGKKDLNRMVNTLTNDTYQTSGRAPFKDEFVTCGGVSLASVNPVTMESRAVPGLYFAGEVLDIDGITGGFNFQAAWTTAFVAAKAMASVTTLPS